MMCRWFALFLALLAGFGPAMAQPVPLYDRSRLAVGATFAWESSNGRSTAVNLGADGEVYRFLVTDIAPDGRQTETVYGTNRQGRLLWSAQNGDVFSYQPDDCSFVPGACASILLHNGVQIGTIANTATYQGGVWTHISETTIQGQAPVATFACGIYDQDSIIQALYVFDSNNGPPYWLRRISGPDAGQSGEMLARVTAACQKAQPNS